MTHTSDQPQRGCLYLIPVPLSESGGTAHLSAAVVERVRGIDHFVVEETKTARRMLKLLGHPTPLAQLHMTTLNEHTPPADVEALLQPLSAGFDVGLMSEAGCPAVADPGAQLVRLAHQQGYTVIPMVGPSSILLALMASGLEGQRFAFQGYLPVDAVARRTRIEYLEKRSRSARETEILIETPYRNATLLGALLETLSPATLLCVACDLTGTQQRIHTASVAKWRRAPQVLPERAPTVFLFLAA
ncbi:MAG: SAM-dependent methyltransferase [Burkholderiales bacterium]|nr:SAM-dependent methyltransferase [Ferrovum sp.]